MSDAQRGNTMPEITRQEHRRVNDVAAKAVIPYGFDTLNSVMTPMGGLVPFSYDYVGVVTTLTADIYTLKSGGSSGTTVSTVTVDYTDQTKSTLAQIIRS